MPCELSASDKVCPNALLPERRRLQPIRKANKLYPFRAQLNWLLIEGCLLPTDLESCRGNAQLAHASRPFYGLLSHSTDFKEGDLNGADLRNA